MKKLIHILAVWALVAWIFPQAPGNCKEAAGRNPAIRFFQDHISAADGDRCSMSPSCSAYAARAVQKHGLVMGWIMACDRLVRCGRNEAEISPHIRINGREYILDPVSANDFWWVDQKGTQKNK